jgi:hypothetical protein
MNEPLTFLATGPTALVARITSGGGRSQKNFSELPKRGQDALSEIVDRLEGAPEALRRLVPRKRRRRRIPAFIPHRSHDTKRPGTMKLARNLGAAASATVFAVDLVSEVRRAAGARRNNSSSGDATGTGRSPAAARRGGPAKAASSGSKASSPTRKATPTKEAPAKKAPAKKAPAKRASAAKKAPAAKKGTGRRVAAAR